MSDSASKRSVVVGLDSGSTGIKVAIADADTGEIVEILPYQRHHNEYETVARVGALPLVRERLQDGRSGFEILRRRDMDPASARAGVPGR